MERRTVWGTGECLEYLTSDSADIQPILLEPICSILQGLYLDIPPTAAPSNDTDSEMTDDSASSISSSASASSVDSLNIPLLEAILRSPIFAHLYYNHSYRATRPTLRPLSGQTASPLRRQTREDIHPVLSMLHCLLPPDFDGEDEHHRTHRGYLREMVYTASNYTEKNDWGPFNSDGEVDWRLLDALSSIMSECRSAHLWQNTVELISQWPTREM